MTDPYTGDVQAAEDARLTLGEAVDGLTVGEVGLIERHYGKDFTVLGGISLTAGLIWAHERRAPADGPAKKFDWADVDKMTMRQVNAFFKEDPPDFDEDNPESESGKGV